jgi:hypothetical protein
LNQRSAIMPCTKFRATSNARAVEPLDWQPVCIMPAKAEPEKVSVIAQAPRTFLRTFITILLREEGVLGMALQRTSSISQSSKRMIALALAKDKVLASVLANALTPAALGIYCGRPPILARARCQPLVNRRREPSF